MDLLTSIPADKWQHFCFSALLFLFDFLIRSHGKFHENEHRCAFYAMRDVLLIGVLKELIDIFGPGNFEIPDLIAADPIFVHGNDAIRAAFKAAKRESNGLAAVIGLLLVHTAPRHRSERFLLRLNRRQKSWELRTASANLLKTLYYSGAFLIGASVEFVTDLLKMPAWSALRTMEFVAVGVRKRSWRQRQSNLGKTTE